MGEFSRYNLLETDVDVKGAAYEEITSSMLKAQRGQFFTPTNVIRLMIDMLDPGGNSSGAGDMDLTDRQNWPRIWIQPAVWEISDLCVRSCSSKASRSALSG